ncbi:MAG: protein kinase domain-containing protein [Myxococcota bacterium]
MTTGAEWSDDTIVDRWSRLGIEPHTFELDANGTIQSRLFGSDRAGDTIIEALAPFERAQLALKGEIKLGREIGRGGLAVVRSATQRSLGRDVAVKQAMADDPGAAYRLVREARILAALDHPNIVPVHMLGVDDGDKPLMVMKRVDGTRWREYVDADGGLRSPEEGDVLEWHLRVLMAVCQVAQYAHAYGIIHRDLKLENIMIGSLGEVYVVDWDLALAVDPTLPVDIPLAEHEVEVLGTPEYMAPEMALVNAHELGPRTDVYLLGACLHTLLTGGARHEGDTVIARIYAAARSEAFEYAEGIPAELAAIANRATSADPRDRYSSADGFRNALVEFLAHRASLRLSAAAHSRLAALEGLLGTVDPSDAYHLQLLVGECRFGFRQALDEWPDNPDAAAGLRRVELGALEHALATENVTRAEVLLQEISDPPHGAVERLAQLEDRLVAHPAAVVTRPVGTNDLNVRVGVMLSLGALWVLGLGTVGWMGGGVTAGTALPILGVIIAAQALLVAVIAVRFNGTLERSHRGAGFLRFLSLGSWMPVLLWPAVAMLTGVLLDALLVIQAALFLVFLLASLLFDRALWLGAVCLLCCALITVIWPEHGVELATVAMGAAYGLTAWRWWRRDA